MIINKICTPTYLQQYAPEYKNKLPGMDDDSKLFRKSEVETNFKHYGYKYLYTATNSSFQFL